MVWQTAIAATDTVWGLVAKLSPENASRIYEIKARDYSKPLIIFSNSIENLREISEGWDQRLLEIASEYWPGALTIVTKRSRKLPAWVNPGLNTIGMRIPKSPSITRLLKDESLLLSTSANLSGQEPVTSYQEAMDKFGTQVDLILEPEQDEVHSNQASTIIEYIDGELKVLREGIIQVSV